MAAIHADMPIPSTEADYITASESDRTTPIVNRLRTPSVSVTPPPAPRFRDESQDLVTAGIQNIRLSEANERNTTSALSPEPGRSRTGTPRARRRSNSAVDRHNVADEKLPQDAFHSPEFQQAFQDAKQLMSNIEAALGSSDIHNEPESAMRKLHQEASRLADFQYPATRTVGFVGDSGVGKSSLLNSLLDTKGLARTSNNGEACTCVVTEYHYHNRESLDLRVNLFSVEELRDQLGNLLQAYRNFELHQNEVDHAEERQDMEANAKVAKDTFQAMFRGRLNDEAFLVHDSYDEALARITQWASEAMPSPFRTSHTGLSLQACSDTLMDLSSEPASRNTPAVWPYIRSIKVYLNAHILSRGLILVDLPGLRDLNTARRNITERYLIQCNEIIAICNIGRAVTDKGVQEVFELAARARLLNVGIVCTRSDEIDPEEAIRDWSGSRARHIEQILEHIEITTNELSELEEDIKDYQEHELSIEEAQELIECCTRQRQAKIRKQNHQFELRNYLIKTRNDIIIEQLRTNYADRVADFHVVCVSNAIYWQHRTIDKTEAMRYLVLSGILQLRKHCISIVANNQRKVATQYMKDQIPALLADIELWVQSGARTASEERRTALCKSLDDVERQLRRDFTSSTFNRIARTYNNDFKEHVYNNRHILSWSRAALTVSEEWAGWNHATYSAFCRNYGNHSTDAAGRRHWNEEAMNRMVEDLERPWELLRVALEQRQSGLLNHAESITDTAIEQLEQGDAAASLIQALESRQRIFLAAIEKANDMLEEALK
ncbi:hypothetical protein ACHAPI_011071 [Fusarium lateritium]